MEKFKSYRLTLGRRQCLALRFLTFAAFIFLISGTIHAKAEQLTSSISWEVTPDGTLLIQGTGEMPDFKFDKPKYWRKKEYEGKIKKIVIGEGITAIGTYNFYNCSLFKGNSLSTVHSVEFPSTLTEIGLGAFGGNNIPELELPVNLRIIGVGAFQNSRRLKDVTITSPELSIWSGAFENCPELEEVNFNNAAVSLSRRAFYEDKALASVKNAANLRLAPGLGFAEVFKNTPVQSLDDITASAEKPAGETSCPVPDGEWDIEYADGGQVYAGEYVRLNFNGTMPDDNTSKEIKAPFGYISSWDDQGSSSLIGLSRPTLSGEKIRVKGIGYVNSEDERYNVEKDLTITYNKDRNSVIILDSDYPDNPVEYLDYHRLRIPEDVFNTGYSGMISYEDRGDDVIGVSFYRDEDKVVMKTVVMHPFMAPPTEVSFYSGRIEGHEIKFTRKIEDLVYDLTDETALDPPFPDWDDIESSGTPCENSIFHYASCLYLDNILLEP